MHAYRLPHQLFSGVVFALAMFFGQYVAATPVLLNVLPGSQLPAVAGGQVQVDIRISGLGIATSPSLGTYDLSLHFDQTALAFDHISWGNGLDIFGLGSLQDVISSAGLVDFFEASLDSVADLNSLQPSEFLLASLVFNGLTTGSSSISLSINALGDASGNSLSGDVNYGSPPNTISEPPIFALLLTAGSIAMMTRRYSSRTTRQSANSTIGGIND